MKLGALALAALALCAGASAQDEAPHAEDASRIAPEPGAQRVDGIAAVVGGLTPGPTVITLLESDVELRARLAILRQSDLRTALGELPPSVLGASLKELLGEALIAAESVRLNMPEPSGAAVAEQRARLLGTRAQPSAARALLSALGVNEREVAELIERRARVDAFLQANLEGTLDTSEEALAQAFQSEAHPFYGEPFEVARDRFERWYAQVKLEGAVERWIVTLSQRTPHRLLVTY
ncbi:MAG TPA: hypothetical protein VI299_26300 [Polyangiales bacterium]